MTEAADADTQAAPVLGEPTDVTVDPGEVTAAVDSDERAGSDPRERTMDTPDQLGGTGGEQSGGAG
jgi:hypothetical protein